MRRFQFFNVTPKVLCGALSAGLLLGGLSGCDKEEGGGAIPASSTAITSAPRPDALNSADDKLKAGNAPEAQKQLEDFLTNEPKSPYRPEAHYLLGKSLAAQGMFQEAKKQHEKAIDLTDDRSLKGMAMLGRADCNMGIKKYDLASRQYHWLETMYRDAKGIPQDEVLFKLGLATKKAGFQDGANYWFNQVIELYSTGPYAAMAKAEHSKYTPKDKEVPPLQYSLEVASYSTKEKADLEAEAFRAKGYKDVEVIRTTRWNYPTYEVHLGKFGNKNDAARAQTDAELAGLKTTIRPAMIDPLK